GFGRKLERTPLLADGRDVPLESEEPISALDIESRCDADDAAAHIKAGRLIGAGRVVAQRRRAPCTAPGDADVSAGPGRDGGRLVDGCNTEVSGKGPRRQRRRLNRGPCRRACAQRYPHSKHVSRIERTYPAIGQKT